ncbi:hypothetical protein ACHABX_02690 [Nesterenkonia halotolerans]|uniref:hypothetical protein n=1 Tax=Nesterenkonia halotolerans TaxID=225325 RepID=UPI003EE4CBCF
MTVAPLAPLPPGLTTPRQATPRDHSRPTYGGHTAAVASMLGWPLLPWQRYTADVAGELDEFGQFVYPVVVITVPRQAGKTTLDLADSLRQCYQGANRRVWYTAQSGQHASDKWREMVADVLMESRLGATVKPRYSNGNESLTTRNGSKFRPHPPTADSLHGKQSDKNTIDEAWHFSAAHGATLLGAITPTTTTRRMVTGQRPQLWIMSTEGTADSEFFNDLLGKVRAGARPDVAFFDWGIDPTTALPDIENAADVDTFLDAVWEAHPGAGHLFVREDLEQWLRDLGPAEFARAYGNRRTGATQRVIPEPDWNAAAAPAPIPDGARVSFAAAAGLDGMDATITATAYLPDGRKLTEVIEHRPGTAWAVPRLKELCAKWGTHAVIDRGGTSAELYDAATRQEVPLIDVKLTQIAGACQALFSGIAPRDEHGQKQAATWLHRPHPALDSAAELAAKRSVGDGAWVWGRRASSGSVSALEAATLSSWGVDHLPESYGLQIF